MRINAYVKTNKPDPTKAMLKLGAFIHARELKIHNWYVDCPSSYDLRLAN